VLGVMVYRTTQPDLPRPFRVPLYPLTPLLFLAISAFAMVYTATAKPFEALCGALSLVAGLGIYPLVATGQKSKS
jgi:APA family basic amino acid/polyamine antiporter